MPWYIFGSHEFENAWGPCTSDAARAHGPHPACHGHVFDTPWGSCELMCFIAGLHLRQFHHWSGGPERFKLPAAKRICHGISMVFAMAYAMQNAMAYAMAHAMDCAMASAMADAMAYATARAMA